MKTFQIAVLIPSYKPEEYLNKCLKSLEKQTLQKENFKIYIALNGPKDSYEKYIKKLLDNYTFNSEYFYIEKAGVSNARNYLIENSNEPFLTFIDDDDLISENYLEELLRVSDVRFIGVSNSYSFKNNLDVIYDNFIGKSFSKLNNIETSKYKSRKYFSPPWAKLIHRDMIKNVRFDTRVTIGEDSLFMAKISTNIHGIKKTRSEKACYYVNERIGSSTRKKLNKIKEIKRIIYLLFTYTKMFFSNKYDKLFILTRIIATLKHHLFRGVLFK